MDRTELMIINNSHFDSFVRTKSGVSAFHFRPVVSGKLKNVGVQPEHQETYCMENCCRKV